MAQFLSRSLYYSERSKRMRIISILAIYNEERFIAACMEHHIAHQWVRALHITLIGHICFLSG
jgi:hypothetical protein